MAARKQEGRRGLGKDKTHPSEDPDTPPPGPISSSVVSCELILTSPSDQARALVTPPDGTTFSIQECLGDTSGSLELVL